MVRLALQFRNPTKDKGCGMLYRYCCGPFQWHQINNPTKIHCKYGVFGTHQNPKILLNFQGLDSIGNQKILFAEC